MFGNKWEAFKGFIYEQVKDLTGIDADCDYANAEILLEILRIDLNPTSVHHAIECVKNTIEIVINEIGEGEIQEMYLSLYRRVNEWTD